MKVVPKRNSKSKEIAKKDNSNDKVVISQKSDFAHDNNCKNGVCTVTWKPGLKN